MGISRPLNVQYRRIGELLPRAGNPRTHSKKQIRQLADSIREFGFVNPVLIDDADAIIAGHGRIAAADLLGIATVPTIKLRDLTETQKRAYILADNKLAELAGWDPKLLAIEFQYLTELDLDFDVTITGFDTADIDLMLQGNSSIPEDPAGDQVPALDPAAPTISRLGDLWLLGKHRLLCGNATQAAAFERLMGGERAQMVFIDPPYNVPIDGHVGGLGEIKHGDFVMAAGEMSEPEFTSFLTTVFRHLLVHSINGSIHFVCMDWRHIYEVLTAGRVGRAELKNLCVWNKDNGGMGTFYRSKHELVFVFKNGKAPHINNFELGQRGRYRTNVWDYAGVNSLRSGRLEEPAMHPTVKPVALVSDAILDCSRRAGVVLDCFAGSGTTLIAAEKTGRRAYAMELDPTYVDTAIRRWEAYAGKQARHAASGRTFTATQRLRSPGGKRTSTKADSANRKGASNKQQAADAE